MGIVLASTAISLDGFISGPNHEMDWVFEHHFLPEGPIDTVEEVIAPTGAILCGRGTSTSVRLQPRRDQRGLRRSLVRARVRPIVLTHRPPANPAPGLNFLSGDIRPAVTTARAAAGDRNLFVPGANVTQQCLEADLIDEILLVQSPVLLGDCIRLFGRPGYREVLFETILATRYGPNPSNGFPKPTRQCESPWD